MSGVNAHAILTLPPTQPDTQPHDEQPSPTELHWQAQDMRPGVIPILHPLASDGLCSRASAVVEVMACLGADPRLGYLWDHRVMGQAILPGAAYLEMTVAAAAQLLVPAASAAQLIAVQDARFLQPFVLPSTSSAAAAVLRAELNHHTGAVQIVSGSGVLHFSASLTCVGAQSQAGLAQLAGAAPQQQRSADAMRARNALPASCAHTYSALAAVGLEYGPAFRQLRAIHQSTGSAAGLPTSAGVLTDSASALQQGYHMHPAALDCTLQLGAVVRDPAQQHSAAQQVFVPAALKLLVAPAVPGCASAGAAGGAQYAYAQLCPVGGSISTHRDHWISPAHTGRGAVVLRDLQARPLQSTGPRPGPGGVEAKTAGPSALAAEALYGECTFAMCSTRTYRQSWVQNAACPQCTRVHTVRLVCRQ